MIKHTEADRHQHLSNQCFLSLEQTKTGSTTRTAAAFFLQQGGGLGRHSSPSTPGSYHQAALARRRIRMSPSSSSLSSSRILPRNSLQLLSLSLLLVLILLPDKYNVLAFLSSGEFTTRQRDRRRPSSPPSTCGSPFAPTQLHAVRRSLPVKPLQRRHSQIPVPRPGSDLLSLKTNQRLSGTVVGMYEGRYVSI